MSPQSGTGASNWSIIGTNFAKTFMVYKLLQQGLIVVNKVIIKLMSINRVMIDDNCIIPTRMITHNYHQFEIIQKSVGSPKTILVSLGPFANEPVCWAFNNSNWQNYSTCCKLWQLPLISKKLQIPLILQYHSQTLAVPHVSFCRGTFWPAWFRSCRHC